MKQTFYFILFTSLTALTETRLDISLRLLSEIVNIGILVHNDEHHCKPQQTPPPPKTFSVILFRWD